MAATRPAGLHRGLRPTRAAGSVPDDRLRRVGTGLCFVVFPLVWVIAFAVHPDLLDPRPMLDAREIILRAHGDAVLQAGHALVTLNTALAVVVAVHFMRLLEGTRAARLGLVGASLAVVGACMLAADKGALCLTMSALDTLPEDQFRQMLPGLLAMFGYEGWMVLVWGLVLMPVGVIVQLAGMWRAGVLARWRVVLLLGSVAFIGFPDGAEIVNLAAAVGMAVAMVPYGLALAAGREGDTAGARSARAG